MLTQAKRYLAAAPKNVRGNTYMGGSFKGLINAPLPVVWNRVKEFQDLSWWHPTKFDIKDVTAEKGNGKPCRDVTAYENDDLDHSEKPFTRALEWQEENWATPEKCLISYSVKVLDT